MTADHPAREKILVIGPAWVGDMVMAQSLFMVLAEQYPDCSITVMAPQWTRPLLDRMPEVTEGMDSGLAAGELALGRRRELGRSLGKEGFTRAYVLPNSFKSALVPFHARIPIRVGWRGEWRQLLLNDCRRLDKVLLPRMVDRFVALAHPRGSRLPPPPPSPRLRVEPGEETGVLQQFDLSLGERVIAICAGAEFGEAKQWPARYFAELVNAMAEEGWHFWFLGSVNDQLITESILADVHPDRLAQCRNLSGSTSLGEAIVLLTCVSAVVSNDSGLMHVAAALQKPVIALFGSTSPDFTPPLTRRVKALGTDIECRPCFKRQCPYGHLRCLTGLKPEAVIAATRELASPRL